MRPEMFINHAVLEVNLYQINNNTDICYPDYVFLCILEGTLQTVCSLEKDGSAQTISLQQQDILLLPPDIPVHLCPTQNIICLLLRLSPEFLLDSFPDDRLFRTVRHSRQAPELRNLLPDCVFFAKSCFFTPHSYGNQSISKLYTFLEHLESVVFSAEDMSMESGSPQTRHQEIIAYIDRHLYEPLSLQDTAAEIGITPQYLSSFFQKKYQCTFLHYVNRRKAEKMLPYLIYTQLSDVRLAESAGFKSLAAFQKSIKSVFGTDIDQLRKDHRPLHRKQALNPADILHDYNYYFSRLVFVEDRTDEISCQTMVYDIDVTFQERMPDSWKSIINLGFAQHMNNAKLRKQIIDFQKRYHFTYGRILQLLHLTVLNTQNGCISYEFDYVYQVLDFLLAHNLIPFIDLGDKYYKYSPRFNEMQFVNTAESSKTYYDNLLRMLPDFIRACCNRYGKKEVVKWHFEVFYNVASYKYYEQGIPFQRYLEYYNKIEQILHTYLPECLVGGCGFNVYDAEKHWDHFFESIRVQSARLDFISLYTYGTQSVNHRPCVSCSLDFPIHRAQKALQLIHKNFPKTPVYITEFNYCHTSRNYLNDSVFHCNYIARYLTETMSMADGIGYYLLSDISLIDVDIEMNTMLFGGNGLYNYYGIQKPSFYAYYFFHELGDYILSKGSNYLFTANTRLHFQGIFFHPADLTENAAFSDHNKELLTTPEVCFERTSSKSLRFYLHGAGAGTYMVKSYRISLHAGNLLASWVKCGYISELPKKSTDFFTYFSNPATDLYTIRVAPNQPLCLMVNLAPLEIQLLLIDCVDTEASCFLNERSL